MEEAERFQLRILARLLYFLCSTMTWQPRSIAERHLAKPHLKVDGWQVIWSCDSPSLQVVAATRDLTNRAKDTFNILPGRHYLSWCNFRLTKGRNTRKLGRMLMVETPAKTGLCIRVFPSGGNVRGLWAHVQTWNNSSRMKVRLK